jgi:hypothetical protein
MDNPFHLPDYVMPMSKYEVKGREKAGEDFL